MNDDTIEEIFTCNELLDHINNSEEDDIIEWKFKKTTGDEGSFSRTHPNHKGLPLNLVADWENGDVSAEHLTIMLSYDPVSFSTCAIDHNLLDQPG